MYKQLQSAGIWWLPGEETKINGTLEFSVWEGVFLKTSGTLGYHLDTIELVVGILSSGQYVTLLNGFRVNQTISGGFPLDSYYFNLGVLNVHLDRPEELELEKLYARLTSLEEWLGISGFQLSAPALTVTMEYKDPDPIEIRLDDRSCLLFKFGHTGPRYTSAVQKKVEIEQCAWVGIHETQKKQYSSLFKKIGKFQSFLTVALGGPTVMTELTGYSSDIIRSLDERNIEEPVEILVRQTKPDRLQEIHPINMLIHFSRIRDRIESIINCWFRKSEDLAPIFDLYFATVYSPGIYVTHRFLNLIQAVEIFHRTAIRAIEYPEEVHRKRITEVLSTCPAHHAKWLESKLKWSNELTLRVRLKELVRRYKSFTSGYIKSSLIHKAWVTRNYLTHRSPELRDQATSDVALYALCDELEVLLLACLFKEISLSDDEVREALRPRIERLKMR